MHGYFCLYFLNLKKNWGGGTLTPPHGGVNGGTHPKIFSIFFVVMWYIKWKVIKNPIQKCQYYVHMTHYLTVSSWKWPKNGFYWRISGWEGHVHTEWAMKRKIGMDNAFCLYFHNPKYFWGGAQCPSPTGGVTGGITPKYFPFFVARNRLEIFYMRDLAILIAVLNWR